MVFRYLSASIFLLSLIGTAIAQEEPPKEFPTYEITIKSARGLLDTDVGRADLTDPYVILYALEKVGDSKFIISEIARTRVIQNSCNPEWNQVLKFKLHTNRQSGDTFYARVVDRDTKMNRDLDIGGTWLVYAADGSDMSRGLLANDPSTILNIRDGFRQSVKRGHGSLYYSIKRHNPNVSVPNYVGAYLRDIKSGLEDQQAINWNIKKEMVSVPAEDGKVLSQDPAAGTSVAYNSTVTVLVGYIKKVSMPDLADLTYKQVAYRLKPLGLSIGKTTYKETTDPRKNDTILAHSPAASTVITAPAAVDLVVYKYVQPEPVVFPEIIGLTYREAAKKLTEGGLAVGRVTKKPFDSKAGAVIETDPDRETKEKLPAGTRVSLVLAAPELLGVSMAFPIEKAPGEMITLNFNKAKEYFVKVKSDKNGYIRFPDPQGNETLPVNGDIFIPGEKAIGSYSNWYHRRVFRVFPQEYYIHFVWDNMTTKNETNAIVKFTYEIVPEMDAFEPNDTINDASLVAVGVKNKIAIYPGDEADWFCYTAEADGYLRVTLDGVPKEIKHPFMFKIYEQGSDKNLHAGEYLPVSVKVFEGKKYFIKTSILGRDSSQTTFDLVFDLVLEKDPTEPNDSIETAYPITGEFTGAFYFMGKAEHDYFKLYPPKWARYLVISTHHPESLMTPRVYWGKNQAAIDESDYCKPEDVGATLPIDASAPYYLHLWNEHTSNFSDIPFELNVTYFPGTDIDNTNTSMKAARSIAVNDPAVFVLAPADNEDWFKLQAGTSQELYVSIKDLVEDTVICRLKDGQDNTIKKLNIKKDAAQNKLLIPKPGTYYLQLFFDYPNISSHQEMTFALLDKTALSALDQIEEAPAQEAGDQEVGGQDLSKRQMSMDFARQAFDFLNKQQYSQSIELYQKAIELHEDKTYWHDMGIAHFRQKQWGQARNCFDKAIALDPTYYLAHKSLGSVYGELKQYEKSIAEFQAALALNRDDGMLYYNIARSYEGLYKADETNSEYLKKAFDSSSKAMKKTTDVPEVVNQFDRLEKKMASLLE